MRAALERVRSITNCELQFMNADIRDANALDKIFNTFKPESVIHFAGLKAVGESVADPLKYYDVNVGGSISLLTAMSKLSVIILFFLHLLLFMVILNIYHMMKSTQLIQ